MVSKFDDIRPFYDEEIPPAMIEMANDDNLYKMVHYVFPDIPDDTIREVVLNIKTTDDMQKMLMYPLVKKLTSFTIDNLSLEGIEHISKDKSYVFVSNHRDIVLDSAIFQYLLVQNNFNTTGILFGDNLLQNNIIRTIAKSNKLFIAFRGASIREFLVNSKKLSEYIRYQLKELNQSVWLAQRNGRTKDGNDLTEQGLVKMLDMSGNKNFVESFSELNIVPFAVSYEYEPCDYLKAREVYISNKLNYKKQEKEDLNSIIIGIKQKKGNVKFSICEPISKDELLQASEHKLYNDKLKALSKIIDKRIHNSFTLWKTNYMAYDIINNTNKFVDKYTSTDKYNFMEYVNNAIEQNSNLHEEKYKEIFLNIYANPVVNKLKYK